MQLFQVIVSRFECIVRLLTNDETIAHDGDWGEATLVTGARIWRKHRVLVVDMTSVTSAMHRRIDGVLGQDILDGFIYTEIDFEQKRLVHLLRIRYPS